MKNALLITAVAICPAVCFAASAARIDFSAGPVAAVSADGAQRPLAKGAEVAAGETIRTGPDGHVQLRFTDGAMVSLQPQTEFKIEAYNYSGQPDGQERGFFNLLKGGLRTISGLIGKMNADRYKVTTKVATIGIRGTAYSAAYTDASNDALVLHTGDGEIQVCNDGGCLSVASGESALVKGQGKTPERTANWSLLPPATVPGSLLYEPSIGEDRGPSGQATPPGSFPRVRIITGPNLN